MMYSLKFAGSEKNMISHANPNIRNIHKHHIKMT